MDRFSIKFLIKVLTICAGSATINRQKEVGRSVLTMPDCCASVYKACVPGRSKGFVRSFRSALFSLWLPAGQAAWSVPACSAKVLLLEIGGANYQRKRTSYQ